MKSVATRFGSGISLGQRKRRVWSISFVPVRFTPLLGLSLLLAGPASASTYEALCPNDPCTVAIDANGISSPAGFMPSARIAQWFTGGEEGYNAGSGTAGALGGATAGAIGGGLLLGPIGLIGGLIGGGLAGSKAGKTADLFFNVVGYDQSGKKTTISFRFVNPKPANKLKTELPMFTGLAMGQTRSLDELRAALGSGGTGGSAALPDTLQPADSAKGASPSQQPTKRVSLPDSLNPQPVIKAASNEEQWQAYLQQRNLVQWAEKNPEMAGKLRQRLFPTASP